MAGVEPEGMTYLQSYSWEGNLKQLCRILETLTQITTAPYIRTADVLSLLQDEGFSGTMENGPYHINIRQTLDGIISDVIRAVLAQEGMTRTKAAQQLGICRATLWKYLKN